jgi:hypothetical protein
VLRKRAESCGLGPGRAEIPRNLQTGTDSRLRVRSQRLRRTSAIQTRGDIRRPRASTARWPRTTPFRSSIVILVSPRYAWRVNASPGRTRPMAAAALLSQQA